MRLLTFLNTTGARRLNAAILGAGVLPFSGAMTRIAHASTEPESQHTMNAADQDKHGHDG